MRWFLSRVWQPPFLPRIYLVSTLLQTDMPNHHAIYHGSTILAAWSPYEAKLRGRSSTIADAVRETGLPPARWEMEPQIVTQVRLRTLVRMLSTKWRHQ